MTGSQCLEDGSVWECKERALEDPSLAQRLGSGNLVGGGSGGVLSSMGK